MFNVIRCIFRFSLLVLEPGEIYFQDYSVVYYPFNDVKNEEEAIKRQVTSHLNITSVWLTGGDPPPQCFK